jgi:hypothetical protein
MAHKNSATEKEKVRALHKLFGDRLIVLWAGTQGLGFGPTWSAWLRNSPEGMAAKEVKVITVPLAPPLNQYGRITSMTCCAVDMFVAFALEQRMCYDHIWAMEHDVHFTNTRMLSSLVYKYDNDPVDLLVQQDKATDPLPRRGHPHLHMLDTAPWILRRAARFKPPFFQGVLNLFRVTSRFVGRLEEWKGLNCGLLSFIEPLFPTLAMQTRNLSMASFQNQLANGGKVHTRWRPCWNESEIKERGPGMFHPVKGLFQKC